MNEPNEMETVTTIRLHQLLAGARPPTVVDLADATSFGHRHIPGSRHVADLDRLVAELDRRAPIVVSCPAAARLTCAWAHRLLQEHGFSDVAIHVGGVQAWEAAGFAVAGSPRPGPT